MGTKGHMGSKLVILGAIMLERTEYHNFTITTHSRQQVEFFRFLLFQVC